MPQHPSLPFRRSVDDDLNSAFERSKDFTVPSPAWLDNNWEGLLPPWEDTKPMNTGVDSEKLDVVAAALTNQPENFKLERALQKVVNDKRKNLEAKEGIDWGTAEALAVGTLLMDGVHCRLSGQDVERGTFSHRHAIWHDQNSGERYIPLNNISEDQNQFFSLKNSPLSEYGVLGFELGYSWETPNQLVMWEAQFGDFMNGAQVCPRWLHGFLLAIHAALFACSKNVEPPPPALVRVGHDRPIHFVRGGQMVPNVGPGHAASARVRAMSILISLKSPKPSVERVVHKCSVTVRLCACAPRRYQGMGPEHSSCRIERFLQSSDEDAQFMISDAEKQLQLCNWQVVNPTTPANYFHLLRRQVRTHATNAVAFECELFQDVARVGPLCTLYVY